jgi:hypothetical protein
MLYYLHGIFLALRRFCRITSIFSWGSCSLSCNSCSLRWGSCSLRWGSWSLSWSRRDSFPWGCCSSRGSLTAVGYVSEQLSQNTALKRLICCKISYVILNKKISMTPYTGNRTNLRHLSHDKYTCSDGNSYVTSAGYISVMVHM